MDRPYQLLLVDDEDIERDAIKYILSRSDMDVFEISEASNGQDGVSQAALIRPDIILMDIQMPGLNGIEAAKIIKKIIPGCKIIFLTAYNQFEYAHEAIKLGVEDFIIKPTANERFLEVMKRTVETIQSDIELREKAEAMEIKLEQVSEYLEREFVSAVTSGDIDKSQADDYLSFFEIPFSNGMGIAIHIYSDQTSETSEIRIK